MERASILLCADLVEALQDLEGVAYEIVAKAHDEDGWNKRLDKPSGVL